MSWDADFDGRSWNYTHNTNRMIRDIDPDWWDSLDGLSGAEGSALLGKIITGLESDPERFRAMNPENGWGDYDSLLGVLREMKRASDGACCDVRKWGVSG